MTTQTNAHQSGGSGKQPKAKNTNGEVFTHDESELALRTGRVGGSPPGLFAAPPPPPSALRPPPSPLRPHPSAQQGRRGSCALATNRKPHSKRWCAGEAPACDWSKPCGCAARKSLTNPAGNERGKPHSSANPRTPFGLERAAARPATDGKVVEAEDRRRARLAFRSPLAGRETLRQAEGRPEKVLGDMNAEADLRAD